MPELVLTAVDMPPYLLWAIVFLFSAISTFALLTRGILGGAAAVFAASCATSYLVGKGHLFWFIVKLHMPWHAIFMLAFLGLLRVQSFLRHGRIRFAETDITRGDA